MNVTLIPIGVVVGTRVDAFDDDWDAERAIVVLDGHRFTADALRGLDEFSHVEVTYLFDRVDESSTEYGARHPRGNTAWDRVGIFAQRAKNRPNRIGHTVARIVRVDGLSVHVRGLDAIDGTPVLDLKPWMAEFGPRGDTKQPAWSAELMRNYWGRATE